jgi:nitrogen fixation NifU-like protein
MPKDDMLGPYSEKVMDHFMNPRNMGEIKDADAVGTVGNPACGDVMRLYLKVSDDKILDAKFKTFGCGAAIATSSMATEMIKGKTVDESLKVTNEAVAEALDGLPANKMHCSVLAQEAIEAAINNYKEKSDKKQTSDEK